MRSFIHFILSFISCQRFSMFAHYPFSYVHRFPGNHSYLWAINCSTVEMIQLLVKNLSSFSFLVLLCFVGLLASYQGSKSKTAQAPHARMHVQSYTQTLHHRIHEYQITTQIFISFRHFILFYFVIFIDFGSNVNAVKGRSYLRLIEATWATIVLCCVCQPVDARKDFWFSAHCQSSRLQ